MSLGLGPVLEAVTDQGDRRTRVSSPGPLAASGEGAGCWAGGDDGHPRLGPLGVSKSSWFGPVSCLSWLRWEGTRDRQHCIGR